jgi:hypothetical protein
MYLYNALPDVEESSVDQLPIQADSSEFSAGLKEAPTPLNLESKAKTAQIIRRNSRTAKMPSSRRDARRAFDLTEASFSFVGTPSFVRDVLTKDRRDTVTFFGVRVKSQGLAALSSSLSSLQKG